MLHERIEKLFNEQINAELYSAYLYLSMAAYFESENLPGFANWMRIQFKEEQDHGLKMFDYVNARGSRISLKAIEAPRTKWDSFVAVFEETLAHEQHVTKLLNTIMDAAIQEKDHATASFMQWFVNEQVEEEATAQKILFQLKLLDGKGQGVLMLDRELAQRVYVPLVAAAT